MAALQDALPAGDGLDIAPILPDIIGEAAILCWLGDAGVLRKSGFDPLDSIHRAAATALARTSLTLVRTAQDFAAAERDEAVRWLHAIAQAAAADVGALMTIAGALPLETLALRELAAWLSQLIADRVRGDAREGQADEAALSRWLSILGKRLSDLGRREEALAASQEAVAISRRLAETRPDAFLPDLAMSLGAHGYALSQEGRNSEAADAFHEGLAVTAPFAERNAQAFGSLVRNLGQDYTAACEAAGTAPDAALLERVAQVIGKDDEKTGG